MGNSEKQAKSLRNHENSLYYLILKDLFFILLGFRSVKKRPRTKTLLFN